MFPLICVGLFSYVLRALSVLFACLNCASCFLRCRCQTASTRARLQYFMMWVVCAILAWILRDRGYAGLKHVGGMRECANDVCTGNGMVLRITLAMVLLSSVICIASIGVRNSKDMRAAFQNSAFEIKWMILFGTIIGLLFIDNSRIAEYAYASAVASSFFLLAGIVLVLEFAHGWNDSWVEKMDTGGKIWGYMIVICSVAMLSLCVVTWALLLKYFGGEHCTEANTFVSITIVLSVFLTLLSLWNKIENGALLPSAVIVTYATYLCTSAIIDFPVDNSSLCVNRHSRVSHSTQKGVYSVGIIFTIFTIGYATIRHASTGQSLPSAKATGGAKTATSGGNDNDIEQMKEVEEDEEEDREYNYSFFHLVYAGGAMYLGMVLINWDFRLLEKNASLGDYSGWTAVYVKLASEWAAFALYAWSLLVPIICSGRDFS
eukprot:c5266_g1_i1.p1 GENE.c5266_g1_i1~~c5266_g1_i1.p1  ORF type:complete len:447 (+),score=93.92 c5266_g1_i1:44-1342(+)